jgi:hypothetical protein
MASAMALICVKPAQDCVAMRSDQEGPAPLSDGVSVSPANRSTEIYWFAGSAAAVAMYFEFK